MELKFRDLKADEIDCRIGQIYEDKEKNPKGLTLLLYKDARVDMDILDETVGPSNWQRSHTRDNANCVVSIWDSEKKQWVSKEDTGTESYAEKEKGLASDSFKRACVNWGIGRELYTSPFIWVNASDCNIIKSTDKTSAKCNDRFCVEHIKIENKKITELAVRNLKTDYIVFKFNFTSATEQEIKMTIKEAEEFKFLSNGKEVLVGGLSEEDLLKLQPKAKTPELKMAIKVVLESKKKNSQG